MITAVEEQTGYLVYLSWPVIRQVLCNGIVDPLPPLSYSNVHSPLLYFIKFQSLFGNSEQTENESRILYPIASQQFERQMHQHNWRGEEGNLTPGIDFSYKANIYRQKALDQVKKALSLHGSWGLVLEHPYFIHLNWYKIEHIMAASPRMSNRKQIIHPGMQGSLFPILASYEDSVLVHVVLQEPHMLQMATKARWQVIG